MSDTALTIPRSAFLTESDMLPKAYLTVPQGLPHFLTHRLAHIERMAAQGMEPPQIGARLNVSPSVLMDAAKHFEDVRVALTGGRARGADELSSAVYGAGVAGNVPAAALLLKAKHGFNAPIVVEQRQENASRAAPVTLDHADTMAGLQSMLLMDEAQEDEAPPQAAPWQGVQG